MEHNHEQLDIALDRLLNGEPLDLLVREFPAHAAELTAHARVIEDISMAASMRPDPEGLRRALSSMRLTEATADVPRFSHVRVSSFFMTYRTALILPALVILIVATGAITLPLSDKNPVYVGTEGTGEPEADATIENTNSGARTARVPEDTQTTSFTPMMMKSADTGPGAQTVPQDQELASVFGPEMQNDANEAQATQTDVAQSANDSEELADYQNAYDEHDL